MIINIGDTGFKPFYKQIDSLVIGLNMGIYLDWNVQPEEDCDMGYVTFWKFCTSVRKLNEETRDMKWEKLLNEG